MTAIDITNTDSIIGSIKQSAGSEIDVEQYTKDRYLVHTGFTYPDGDELHIVLTKKGNDWILTDDGHTMMWLSYEEFNMTDSRKDLLNRTLNTNGISLDDGKLSIKCPEDTDGIGVALRSMIMTELQMADLLYLGRRVVKSTFVEDLKSAFVGSDISDRCHFDAKVVGPDDIEYNADVLIDCMRPILVFGIRSPVQCARATVSMLSLNRDQGKYLFMIVFDKDCQIPRRDAEKAINASIKTVYGSDEAVNGAKRLLSFS